MVLSSGEIRQKKSQLSFPSSEWFKVYADELSQDAEWRAIGKFFSCSYMLDVSGEKFILTFVDGVLVNVKSNPLIGPLYSKDGWSFAIRAPLDTWKKSLLQNTIISLQLQMPKHLKEWLLKEI